ncbi:lymphocyte antigen 75-like [Epargyreus clarus]|uniref:lymphocyte antigen 75-like n=1 Tax=Epargyreus clarus TaxID=520877 RepID=UPI003C2CA630
MWSKYMVFLLLIAIQNELSYGQLSRKFFRKDYTFIDDINNFYKINPISKTWADAKVKCVMEGATLFYPEDEEEAMAVIAFWNATMPKVQNIWVGVAAWNVREIYETIDGRPVSEVYDNWAFNEPNNADSEEGCVVLQKDGTLSDENCSSNYGYVCKKTLATLQWNNECNLPVAGYKYNKQMDRCYKFHLTPANWTEAYTICHAEQSYLAIINSQLEDEVLINITAAAPKDNIEGSYLRGAVHLGFHDKNGIWETIKGVPLHDSGFGHGWGYTQPDGKGDEKCGSMFYTGELNDIGCWQRMFFICEHELVAPNVDFNPSFSTNEIPNLIESSQFRKARYFRKDYVYIDHVNNFYKISTLPKSWAETKSKCTSDGATLFFPEHEVEAEAVMGLLKKQPGIQKIWIGVAAWNAKELYETIDGRSISDVYKKWALNEPDNAGGNENCVVMQRDGTLKDENCDIRYSYICKKTLATVHWDSICGLPVTGYKYIEDMKKCYKFHLTPMNWTDAYIVCQAEQSHLAIINSALEDEYLVNISKMAPKDDVTGDYLRGAVHLGFHSNNGFWETIEGVPLRDSGFGDGWGYTQPDGSGQETCGSMFYTGQLNDISCWQRMFFICEHDVADRSVRDKNKTARYLARIANVRSYVTRGRFESYILTTIMTILVLSVI